MSLINQMLKDIEARRKPSGQRTPDDGFPATMAVANGKRGKLSLKSVVALSLGTLLGGALIWIGAGLERPPVVSPATVVVDAAVAAVPVAAPVPVVEVTPEAPVAGADLAPSTPESVSVDASEAASEPVPVAASVDAEVAEPLPAVARPKSAPRPNLEPTPDPVSKVAVAAPLPKRAQPTVSLPVPVAAAELKTVRLSGRIDQPRLVVDLDRRPESAVELRSATDQLVLHLPSTRFAGIPPAVPAGGVIRAIKVRQLPGATELLLRLAVPCNARKAWRPARISGGTQLLVDLYPQTPFPAEAPVSALPSEAMAPAVKPGDTSRGAALAEGAPTGESSPLRMEDARRLVERGAFAEARSLLLQSPQPALYEEPEYYALLAATQQRLGRYDEAVAGYRQLLLVFPENGTWWMGLGIALESNGQRTEAGDGYRRALATPGLRPELAQYVRQRLAALE